MRLNLVRHPLSPLMYPNPLHQWESLNVFNCAVTQHNGLFHMLYRAQGVDFTSHIGYAVSIDGLNWNRLEQPIWSPHNGLEDYRGVEDPRVTQLDGVFYMCYTAYGANQYFPMIARSENLIAWSDIAPLEKAPNKDHVLFPDKIDGRYVILHRRSPNIWIAYSDDLVHWTDHAVIMRPLADLEWQNKSIGSNGVPIKTDHGWVLFYHGYGEKHIYRHSIALLDLDDPTRVIHRPRTFIMEPTEVWEIRGDVPNVVFSCTNLVVSDQVYFYYAGADRLIGLANAPFADVLEFARGGE